MPVDDGGPAFPTIRRERVAPITGDEPYYASVQYPGMSLRDWFAGKAMVQLADPSIDPHGPEANAHLAEACYLLADAMLAERSKEPPDAR